MLAGTRCQLCQPPVFAMAKLPSGAAPGLSRRTSTRPETPPAAPEAACALNCVAGVPPKFTPSNRRKSPLPPGPTNEPAFGRPCSWLADSAWMVPYASRPPGGPPVGVGVGVGPPVGDGGPPQPPKTGTPH